MVFHRSPTAAFWLAGLLVAVCCEVAPGGEPVRVEFRAADGTTTAVEGSLEVEAADGGLLIARPDQRLEVIDPERLIRRTALPAALQPGTPQEVGRRVLGELPAGFDVLVTKHYVVCYDTSRAYAQWAASLFERLSDAFTNFWTRAGFDVARPKEPLIVVIFADRHRYEEHASGDLGAASDRVVGYYNMLSNRITTYDLTGSAGPAGPAGRSPGRAGLDILARPEAAGLVATLVHEATHQMAFNSGLHQRLAPVPVWACEGVATYFETPDVDSDRGWRAIGGVNVARQRQFLTTARRGWIEPLITADDAFRRPDVAIDAYAQAWALTAFLIQTKKQAFVNYLQTLAAKRPFAEDSPAIRREDFVAAFGEPGAAFEDQVTAFVARLRAEPRR